MVHQTPEKIDREVRLPGGKLREARVGQRIPLREVASKAGISQATLSRIERGKQTLDVMMLVRIATILGKEPRELFRDADDDGDTPARIFASLSPEERIQFWQLLKRSEEMRIAREGQRRPSGDLLLQVEELLAQLDFLRTEVEAVRAQLRRGQ